MRSLPVVALVLLALLSACKDDNAAVTAEKSVYDKVMASGEINCGYGVYPPYLTKDANTGAVGGLYYDIMQELGKRLSLNIKYTTELGWGTAADDIKNHKVDMACSHFWANPSRARVVDFSQPVVFDRLWAYVRADDTREFRSYDDLNKPDIKAITLDGSAEGKILENRFSNVQRITLPELTPASEYFMYVSARKVDFFLMDNGGADAFMKEKPGIIKRIDLPEPAHTFPGVMLLPAGESHFKNMIDAVLREMDLDGTLTALLKKYELDKAAGRMVYMK